ncbi:MAG: four-carbon acid sugar kinase family protein, partial [Candidatus Hodarchaeales archaeon]
MRIAVIADDLTGALDTGVQFSKWGLNVKIVPILENIESLTHGPDVLVVNTNSR